MATRQRVATEVDGLVNGWDESGLSTFGVDIPRRVYIDSGAALGVFAQIGNTSATDVAGQAIGTVKITSGTADGATITLTNALITATSYIFLQIKQSGNRKIILDTVVPAAGSATFTVRTVDAGALTADCDVWYLIVN